MLRFFSISLTLLIVDRAHGGRLSEDERVREWHKKNTWPPTWHEESPGYRRLMEQREAEIQGLEGANERWENWLQFVQGRYVKSFTQNGYLVADIPKKMFTKLKSFLAEAVKPGNFERLHEEGPVDAIFNSLDLPAKMSYLTFSRELLEELRPLHEQWAGGIKLQGSSVYGLRIYQNGSSLAMHHDIASTHVISSIVHVGHEYDDDNIPWPIEIENHRTGELVSVNLEPGQMLFYESAKCLHGRMTELKGRFYSSVFVHYRPVDTAIWQYDFEEIINAVPPHWRDGITSEYGDHWAGASITTPSRRTVGSLKKVAAQRDRMIQEEENVHNEF